MNNIHSACILLMIGFLESAAPLMAGEPFRVSVRMDPAPEQADAGLAETEKTQPILAIHVAIPEHHRLYADQFQVEVPAPARLIPRSLPTSEQKIDPFSGDQTLVFTRSFEACYAIENLPADILPVTVRWQGCDDTVCFLPASETFMVKVAADRAYGAASVPVYPAQRGAAAGVINTRPAGTRLRQAMAGRQPAAVPQNNFIREQVAPSADWRALTNRFTIIARRAGYLSAGECLALLESAQGEGKIAADDSHDLWMQRSLWLSILILLAGGLALNLTPCVLPMIPINLAIIGAGTLARSRRRGAALGALYGLGMAAAYGALGLLVVLTGSKFGALNASPWFNLGVAVLFVVLALAMFDVYAIDFSRFQGRFQKLGSGSGALVIFALGALAALLAGACVAPVVLSALLLAANLYSQGHGAALILPFVLGLGMALPWPLAGAGLAFLPKPGRWMNRIKYGFGVLILLAAMYYAWTGLSLWRQSSPGKQSLPSVTHEGWLSNLPEALVIAEREGKPVFIDFWASWCKNCHAMEATTFRNEQVRRQLESFVKVKVQAEHPNQPPDRDILDAFGVMGLPTYVILKSNQ